MPGSTLSISLASPALALLQLLPLHIRCLTSMGRGSGTVLRGACGGWPQHPSTSLHGAGSCGAPTFLRQCSPGDTHHLPPCPLMGQHKPLGRRQAHQGSAALGGSSSPSPTPARAVAGMSCCHNPLVAYSCWGKHLVQSLPSQTTSPPSSPARTHRAVETISASAFIKLPPVAVLQQELGRESSWAQAPKSGSAWG